MEDIGTMLDREYEETLKTVSLTTTSSDEARWQLEKLNDLHRQRMNEIEIREKAERNGEEFYFKEKELELKREQLKEGRKDRIVKIILEGVAILIPAAVSSYWMAKGLRFEEKGTFTSRTGQWQSTIQRLFKK